ncbi:MAG: esterase/lipase family protein [Candidatus Bipolaricaulia bacterium]
MQPVLIWLLLAGFLISTPLGRPPGCEADVAKPYLVAEDSQPLGDRIPLILIHGWIGECSGGKQGWENVIARIKRGGGFALFKVYRFIYPSRWLSLEQAGRALEEAIAAKPELHARRLLLIGHSRGGLVARTWMEFDGGGERTIRLITLATPHHGSPLASLLAIFDGGLKGRVKDDLKRIFNLGRHSDLLLSGAKLLASLGYQLFFGIDDRSLLDMRWDNYDGLVQEDYAQYSERVREALDNLFLQRLNAVTRFDRKIIAYYGYLSSRAPDWQDPRRALYQWSGELERALPGDFRWNDGLIPIQSASFAGHEVERRGPFPSMSHIDIRDHPQVLRQLMEDLKRISQDERLRGRTSPREAAASACDLIAGPLKLCAN